MLFVYTGIGEGVVVPDDAVRVRIDPSVLVIPEHAFFERCQLETIELQGDDLREIGEGAFCNCKALNEVHLSDGVERIGNYAFYRCNFAKFRSRRSLPQSLRECYTYVDACFPWSYQKLSFE